MRKINELTIEFYSMTEIKFGFPIVSSSPELMDTTAQKQKFQVTA